MMLDSLLISQDVELVRVLRPTLEKLSIQVEICQEANKASEILITEKFDAVIVDCDDVQGGLKVLEGVRATPSNKNSVTFAVLNGKQTTTQEVFGMGVNFVLQKPISTLNATRCFNAALSFMVRERRRYFRAPVEMPVRMTLDGKEFEAVSANISEGGISLTLPQPISKTAKPRLMFTLPETSAAFDLETEVAWMDGKGHAGLRFQNVPPECQQKLDQWLSERIEPETATPQDAASGSN
jgi:DNA-binding response OmpR family regulator